MSSSLTKSKSAGTAEPQGSQLLDELRRSRTNPGYESHVLYSPQFMDDHGAHHYHAYSTHDDDVSTLIEEQAPEEEGAAAEAEEQDESQEEEEEEVLYGVRTEHDIELRPKKLERNKSTKSIKDPNLVTWNGVDDPENPKNWTNQRKWAATLIVSAFTFISPVSSSMVAPAVTALARDLRLTQQIEESLAVSIFVLAYAIGPLFLGPLSEIYGRVIVLQLGNLLYLVFNLAGGFAQNTGEFMTFRFLAGLGGSAPLALGGGVLSDCWRAEERGKSISIYSLAPLLGPAVGPVAGSFIAERTTWRWVFWSTSIVDAGIQILGFFYLQETYAPTLLAVKAKKLRKETGNEAFHTEWETPDRTLGNVLKQSLSRPFILLGTQPIVQALALYMAYLYGLMYLVLTTFPSLWVQTYRENTGIAGLNYIALGLGFFAGTQVCAPINDMIYKRLKARNNNVGRPEFRVPLMIPGALLVPIGLFIYGWTSEYRTFWIGPDIGACLFAAGTIIGFQCLQTYLVDAYVRYAASAVGAATVLRSCAGFGFPLFAPYMYKALGLGWGNSLLGFIAIVLGIPAPILLWKYGQKLRERSKFAAG